MNNLKTVVKDNFSGISPFIMDIDLYDNELEIVENGTFWGLENLRSVNLKENNCDFEPKECNGDWQGEVNNLQFCECKK